MAGGLDSLCPTPGGRFWGMKENLECGPAAARNVMAGRVRSTGRDNRRVVYRWNRPETIQKRRGFGTFRRLPSPLCGRRGFAGSKDSVPRSRRGRRWGNFTRKGVKAGRLIRLVSPCFGKFALFRLFGWRGGLEKAEGRIGIVKREGLS
jgi:hypothetical protein